MELLLSLLINGTRVFVSICLFDSVRGFVFDVDCSGVLLGCVLVKSVVLCFLNLEVLESLLVWFLLGVEG